MEQKSRWKNKYAVITAFDNLDIDTDELTDIIRGTIELRNKYLKRAELKPMAKTRGNKDSHDTSRALHMRQAAEIAKKIAHKLGLNEIVAYNGMLMHDAGHAFFGHEGEHTMNVAGKLLNTGYFHHNAKGIDVILSENLIGKIVEAIPEAKKDKKLREQLEKDAWYFLDVVVSHDGEATSEDNKIKSEDTLVETNIKNAVLRKTRKSNRENIYKCNPETLEAIISKPSDVIAYIKSDLSDAFSEGILTRLGDEHFETIGAILCESREERDNNLYEQNQDKLKQERTKKGQELLLEYRKKFLRELPEDIDQEKLEIAESVLKQAKNEGIDIFSIYTEEDMKEYIDNLKETLNKKLKGHLISKEEYDKEIKTAKEGFVKKYKKTAADEKRINEILEASLTSYEISAQIQGADSNTIFAGKNKIIEYVQKLTKERKRVIEEVMNDIQEALIDDYVEATKEKWKDKDDYQELKTGMNFSKGMSKLLYNKLKAINYKEYVQHTKKVYQEKSVPEAVLKTVKECARSLVKTGVIRNKFYDPVVLSKIENNEVKEYMKVPERDEEEYETYKRNIGICKGVKLKRPKRQNKEKRFKGTKSIHRRKLYKEMYSYVQSQDTRFAMNCEDVYYAIENTVRTKVNDAYSEEFVPEDYLKKEQLEELKDIRTQIGQIYEQLVEKRKTTKDENVKYLEEAKEIYIKNTIQKERENLEEKVAAEIAIKYIAGMTDRKIVDVLFKVGNLSKRKFKKQDIINGKNAVIDGLIKSHEESKEEPKKVETCIESEIR